MPGAARYSSARDKEDDMRNASVPITLIVVGVAWLLWYFRLFPDIDWVIAAGLVGGGIAIFVLDRITKTSVVTGTFLIAAGIAWALHDRAGVSWFVLVPALLIILGVLMLVARSPRIPESRSAAERAG
jgi:hypothetical protein